MEDPELKKKQSEDQWPIGTPVQLIGGGRRMTVSDHNLEGDVFCIWETASGFEERSFKPGMLQKYNADQNPDMPPKIHRSI